MANTNMNSAEPQLLTPEEMKAIGEIELGPSRHERFLNNHYKKLIVGIVAFMLLASAVIVYASWKSWQESNAAAAAISAIRGAQSEAAAEEDPEAFSNLIAGYPGTPAAATAELMLGMQQAAAGHEQEGVQRLQHIIDNAAEPFLRARAQAFLAGYYMRNGDTAKATALWQALQQDAATPYQALALLMLGDLAKLSGDTEQAQLHYTKLMEVCPSSPLVARAHQRLLLLGVDAPEPVAPPAEDKDKPAADGVEWPSSSSLLQGLPATQPAGI